MVRNCGFSETFFFVVCDDIWIAIYPSFVVVLVPKSLSPSCFSVELWNGFKVVFFTFVLQFVLSYFIPHPNSL